MTIIHGIYYILQIIEYPFANFCCVEVPVIYLCCYVTM